MGLRLACLRTCSRSCEAALMRMVGAPCCVVASDETAATASSSNASSDRSLGPDVGAVVPKSAELSEDGRTLSLKVWNAEGKEESVVYSVWEDQLSRTTSDGQPRLVARYQEFRFLLEGSALSATWRDEGGRKKQNWALDRW